MKSYLKDNDLTQSSLLQWVTISGLLTLDKNSVIGKNGWKEISLGTDSQSPKVWLKFFKSMTIILFYF